MGLDEISLTGIGEMDFKMYLSSGCRSRLIRPLDTGRLVALLDVRKARGAL